MTGNIFTIVIACAILCLTFAATESPMLASINHLMSQRNAKHASFNEHGKQTKAKISAAGIRSSSSSSSPPPPLPKSPSNFGATRGWQVTKLRQGNNCDGMVRQIMGQKLTCQQEDYGYYSYARSNTCAQGPAFTVVANVETYAYGENLNLCNGGPVQDEYFWTDVHQNCAMNEGTFGTNSTECVPDSKHVHMLDGHMTVSFLNFASNNNNNNNNNQPPPAPVCDAHQVDYFVTTPVGACIPTYGQMGSMKLTSCSTRAGTYTFNSYGSGDCSGQVMEMTESLYGCGQSPYGGVSMLVCHE